MKMKTALKIHRQLGQFKEVVRQRNNLLAACKAVASLKTKTLLGPADSFGNEYSLGANAAFCEAASLVEHAISRAEGKEVAS